jgi:pyrimidine-specific ribonucleoside hydrolase
LTAAAGNKPVLFDTDMGSDDWLAALLLLLSPRVDLKAITVTGAGLARRGFGGRHARGLAALAGRPDVAVAEGGEFPLAGGNAFPAAWRDDADGLCGLTLPPGPAASTLSAVETILALSRAPGPKLTLVATGPLTNVALALLCDPSLAGRLEMVYVMGGAVEVEGNVAAQRPWLADRAAEWNVYVDPRAAAVVLAQAPVTLVPLDATNAAPVTTDFHERLGGRRTTPSAEFVHQVLTQQLKSIRKGEYYFWDALAAAVAIDERLTTITPTSVRVVEEGPEQGRTEPSAAGARVRVCRGARLEAMESVFLDALSPPAVPPPPSEALS